MLYQCITFYTSFNIQRMTVMVFGLKCPLTITKKKKKNTRPFEKLLKYPTASSLHAFLTSR